MSVVSPSVEIEISAGTLRATLAHGHVYFAWRRRGSRSWETSRKTLDESESFAGALSDFIGNERLLQRSKEIG